MSFVNKRVAHCDQCGHEWIAEVAMPYRCPKRYCRAIAWNQNEQPNEIVPVKDIDKVRKPTASETIAKAIPGVTVASALPRKIRGAKLQDEAFVPFEEVE